MGREERVRIGSDADIVLARQRGREMAARMGFSSTDLVLITTAISELARNIILYAEHGEIVLRNGTDNGRDAFFVIASDRGPGIPNIEQAMRCGYSTSGNLGLGLPGVRRLMDEMTIESKVGEGTTVVAKKWKP